eukprot:scaffold15510_cov213-Amphora_coffeaeformis.AAC.8
MAIRVWYSAAKHSAAKHSAAKHSAAKHSAVKHSAAKHSAAKHSAASLSSFIVPQGTGGENALKYFLHEYLTGCKGAVCVVFVRHNTKVHVPGRNVKVE